MKRLTQKQILMLHKQLVEQTALSEEEIYKLQYFGTGSMRELVFVLGECGKTLKE